MLGNQRLPAEELSSLGASLQAQVSARRFVDPVRRYFDELPSRYSQFRRERVSEGRWYRKDGFGQSDIAPLEVDVILLAPLWGMRALLRERRIARAFAGGSYAMLKPAYERSRHRSPWTKLRISRPYNSRAWRRCATFNAVFRGLRRLQPAYHRMGQPFDRRFEMGLSEDRHSPSQHYVPAQPSAPGFSKDHRLAVLT